MTQHESQLPESLLRRSDGGLRRVGFEIEFGGLTFDDCLAQLSRALGGSVDRASAIEAKIAHPEFGDFELELDWQFLKEQAREAYMQDDVMKIIGDIAGTVVPLEVVFPPIDANRLDITNDIVKVLHDAGASGTHSSPLYAFGVHINTELPDLEASTLTRYLKAYALLQQWLIRAHSVDSSRRISPYVDPYKRRYLNLVIDYDSPDVSQILGDYLEHNATRNRALDMLPIFSMIDADRVQRAVQDSRVNARPAFHYRMPNCDIGNPDWSLITEWNRWCVVEQLAASDELETLADRHRHWRTAEIFPNESHWLQTIDDWIAGNLT